MIDATTASNRPSWLCAVNVFRRFVREHPGIFRITFQRAVAGFEPGPEVLRERTIAFDRRRAKVRRLADAGVLRATNGDLAVIQFQALCEGLGNFELRGTIMAMLPDGEEEEIWRTTFTTLARSWATRPRRTDRAPATVASLNWSATAPSVTDYSCGLISRHADEN